MTALKFWVVFAMLIMTFNEKRYFGCVFFFCPFSLKGVLCYQNFFFFFAFSMMEALTLLWHLILKGENYQYYQRWLFLSVIGETYMFEQGEYI